MERLKIYIAGPYRANGEFTTSHHIHMARNAAGAILRKGHIAFCPHTMTAHFDVFFPDIPSEVYLETDLEWVRCCDAILMLSGWENSDGARTELEEARRLGLKVFYELDKIERVE